MLHWPYFFLSGVEPCLNVAGYRIEEMGRWPIGAYLPLPNEDNVLNKFRIWKERHYQIRETRTSHLVG